MAQHGSREFTQLAAVDPEEESPREGTQERRQGVPAPEEQLTRKDPQKWALGLGLAGLLLASWATCSPIFCTAPLEMDLTQCSGVFGVGKSSVRLPGYCWTGCAGRKAGWVLTTLGVAVLGQTVVVVLNDGNFKNVCALSWYFDLYDQLVQSDHFVQGARDRVGAGLDTQEARLGPMGRSLFQFARRQIEGRLEEPALQARSIGESVTSSRVHRLTSAVGAQQLAYQCFRLALLQLMLIFLFDFSMRHSRFTCEGDGDVVEKAAELHANHGALISLVVSSACVALATFLVWKAKWAVHVKVRPVQKDDRSPYDRLRAQFTGSPPRPNLGRNPEEDFMVLKCVPGKELVGVRSKDILYEGAALQPLLTGAMSAPLELESEEEVVLLFRDCRPTDQLDKPKACVSWCPQWSHRIAATNVLMLACLLLWLASSCCWTCVQAINVPADPKISVADLHERLLLMGACGRHAAIGTASMLGSVALALAAVQQILIRRYSAESTTRSEEGLQREREEQLIRPLLDFRRHGDLSLEEYEEEFEGNENDDKVAEVMCYVWEDDQGEVLNSYRRHSFRSPGDRSSSDLKSQRDQLRRSSLPRKVRLVRLSKPVRQRLSDCVPAKHYSKPSIAIEILDEPGGKSGSGEGPSSSRKGSKQTVPQEPALTSGSGGDRIKQIVPPEFIAGSFHVSVNLGPKQACEKVSAAVAFAAVLLAMADLALYFGVEGRGLLLSRPDVLTETPCVYFEVNASTHGPVWGDSGEDIEFRLSLGPYLACAGGLLAMIGMLGLRVANDKDRATDCRGCLASYCRALRYSFWVCWSFVQWAANSVPAFFKNCTAQYRAQAVCCGCCC